MTSPPRFGKSPTTSSSSLIPPPPPIPSKAIFKNRTSSSSSSSSSSFSSVKKFDFSSHVANFEECRRNQEGIDWQRITEIGFPGIGSSGVFFVHHDDLGTFVVKGSNQVVQELFCSRLAETLGFSVPRMFILDWSSPPSETSNPWGTLQQRLNNIATSLRNQGQTNSGVSRVFKELNRAYLTLMEFISGKDATSLSPSEGREGEEEGLVRGLFTNEDVLRQIGHVIAFDLLVNNWDRTPVVWEHGECNLGNLFFELKPIGGSKPRVVGIDTSICSINRTTSYGRLQNYLNKVRDCLQFLTNTPQEEFPGIRLLRESIQNMTRFDYGLSGSLQIQKGILEGIKRIIERLSRTVLEELKEDLKKTIVVDWENVWETGIRSLDLEFLMDLFCIFIRFKDSIELVLQLEQQGSAVFLSSSRSPCSTSPPVFGSGSGSK